MQFHVKFTDIDGQIQMAEHLRTRSMLKNSLACDGMDYDVVENHKPLSACLLCLPFSFSQDVLDFPTDNEEWDEIKLECQQSMTGSKIGWIIFFTLLALSFGLCLLCIFIVTRK